MYRLINNCSSIHNFDYVHLDPIATIFVEELHVFTKCLIDSLSVIPLNTMSLLVQIVLYPLYIHTHSILLF
jgi:hypothetical protein